MRRDHSFPYQCNSRQSQASGKVLATVMSLFLIDVSVACAWTGMVVSSSPGAYCDNNTFELDRLVANGAKLKL